MTARRLIALLLGVFLTVAASADEGMWTFHDFPQALLKQQHGVDISSAWLDRVRTSTVRLSNCTASFVSSEGLILTNHHCAAACLDEHSTDEKNLIKAGFLARTREQELRCGTQVADVLMAMENVTDKIEAATRNLSDQAANEARKKTLTQLEQACEQGGTKAHAKTTQTGPLKCESVNLYQGAQYWLYKYKRYDDVRLVFAPEEDIAAFGGDPDNFQFPRWCLDMSILRAYDSHGKPATTPSFLHIRPEGPRPGEVVFVSGHPGSTDRLLTVAELEELRDVTLPHYLLRASELRGRYIQFGKTSPEAHRIVENPLTSLENVLKVRREELDALLDDRLLQHKRADEAALRAKMAGGGAAADPWGEIAKAVQLERQLSLPYTYLEAGAGFNSRLFAYARTILRGARERQKPNADRLREFRDTALPRIEQQLKAPLPIYPQLENLTLSFSLERMREWLGPDDAIVRKLLAKDSPDTLAARVISGSTLADPKERMRLWSGGMPAVEASQDPMIELARALDPTTRELRKRYEDEVEAPLDAAAEQIARARFRAYGTSVPPDATFTLRLNFGTVQGWKEGDHEIEPFTYLSRLYTRATGQEPFKVPDSWLTAQGQLDMQTKFDLSTNNDIVGGNSGSPLLDAQGRLIGLMFDGNIHSIAGSYWFDPELNRAVAVHPAIMLEGLRKVYKADQLLAELGLK